MAGQQRKCANCRFFSDAGMPGNGWCTHPKRQLSSGVKLLVRGGELACRNSWGGDLFQSRLDDEATPAAAADLPGNDQDDEVTSVTIPSTRPAPPEDRVVRDRPAIQRPTPDDANDAAHRDQEERARVMARGSRDALAHARHRYSTRHQQAPKDDDVADDNISESANDRVVTRQERFSDREFGAGMPRMRTAPVPREEVEQRSFDSQDRFNTVPEIDPNFDMPGQRQRSEPIAAAAPDLDPPPAPETAPPPDDEQITAYEHVLQRARRIRASKQERVRPIRHTDILPGREDTAPPTWADQPEPEDDVWVEEQHAGRVAPPAAAVEAATAYDDPAWADGPLEGLDDRIDEDNATVEVWDEPVDDDLHVANRHEDQFEDEIWDEHDAEPVAASWEDEDDYWDDDDADAVHPYQPEPRRLGWLGRFRLGRRSHEPVYDDATITRHADMGDDYLDDEPFAGDEGWPVGDADHDYVDEEPFVGNQEWPVDDVPSAPSWGAITANDRQHEVIEHDRGWVRQDPDPAPAWNDAYDNDIPAWREPARAHFDFDAEDLSAAAPVPPPVPTEERASQAWDVASMPVRPVAPPRSRQRLDHALPDLDDALFDDRDDRVIHAQGGYGAPGVHDDAPDQNAIPARDSYFRASRYPRPESAVASPYRSDQDVSEAGATLPDLDGDRLDVRDVVARGAELVDRRIEVAPDVPRQCRTCRSFRSADGGTRGWCTNEWAFTHRRMVNDDDLACVSAIGCWWLPADHLRLDLDDAYDDARTPRMDELIASKRPAKRRVAGE